MNHLKPLGYSLALILLIGSYVTVIQASSPPGRMAAPSSTPYPTATPRPPSPTSIPTPTRSPALATLMAQENCLHSFVEFAYFGIMNLTTYKTLPTAPWQYEAAIPYDPIEIHHPLIYPSFVIELTRWTDGEEEIWIRGWEQDIPIWLIYRPESHTWERVSRQIDDTVLFGGELFVSPDGTLWSNVEWGRSRNEIPNLETFPVLSQFDETTRRFVFPESVMETPLEVEEMSVVWPWPEIILDEQGVFWIFVQHDGLYRYDPATETTEKKIELPEYPVLYNALSPDGPIYFSKPTNQPRFAVVEEKILQYIPETDEVIAVDIPDELWLIFQGMLFDQSGRLWLGSTGYRDLDGNWHFIDPYPEQAFDHAGDYWWVRPFLLTESSDGRLWYIRFIDGQGDGTAWYDPEIGEGCLFTDYPSTVIEDSTQQLWMIADGKLYKYPLNP